MTQPYKTCKVLSFDKVANDSNITIDSSDIYQRLVHNFDMKLAALTNNVVIFTSYHIGHIYVCLLKRIEDIVLYVYRVNY